jgi:alpha-mannosidase
MKTYHVVSHTHWDREWYRPLAVMKRHLMELMDHLLEILNDQPDYVFHLDAQTICLEDYLEVRPDRRPDVEKFVRARRLLVGPWYVQNDFFLTSGESTIRNLLLGRRIARAFGHCDAIGYAPDQFGLIGQLPQILRGFGIDNCVFARAYDIGGGETGKDFHPNEFLWASPDGSEILGIFLSSWYNNAQRFSSDPAKALLFLRNAGAGLAARSLTPHLLMMNGVDHLEAQENLLPILDALDQNLPEGESVRQSTITEYLAAVREYLEANKIPLRRLVGEMRYGNGLLQGTLSGWSTIKRRNVEAQALLELQAEPESVMFSAFAGLAPDFDYQQFLWKKLIENHPHDTICACSNDRVQEDAINRLENVISGAADIIHRARQLFLERLDRRDLDPKGYLIAVFNPLPFDRTATVPAKLFIPLDEAIERMRLIDPEGKDVDFEVIGALRRRKATFSPINLPGMIEVMEIDILLDSGRVPACGYRVLRMLPGEGKLLLPPVDFTAAPDVLENEFLEVRVSSQGRVDLLDKTSGLTYPDVIGFTDETDLGSAYHFRPVAHGEIVSLDENGCRGSKAAESGSLRKTISVDYVFERSATYDFAADSPGAHRVASRLTVSYSLRAGSRNLDLDLHVENRSEHHRLRVVFRPGFFSDSTIASTPFDLIERERANNTGACRDQPNAGVISLASGDRQMTIFNAGLCEYEHCANGEIALTLLRSFTTINDIENIGEPARFSRESTDFSCPKSAMIGDFRLRAALRLGKMSRSEMANAYHDFLCPLSVVFDSADSHKFCGGRPCVQDSTLQELFFRDPPAELKTLPHEKGLMRVTGNVVVTALKPAENGVGYILRLFNPEAGVETASIAFSPPPSVAKIVSMDEEREIALLAMKGASLEINVNPRSIVTIRLSEN